MVSSLQHIAQDGKYIACIKYCAVAENIAQDDTRTVLNGIRNISLNLQNSIGYYKMMCNNILQQNKA